MKYKVMIVEDQTMPRELFELRIQSSEHFETVLSIDNASLAEVYCLRFPVDLILMDVITRNGENGLDAAAPTSAARGRSAWRASGTRRSSAKACWM